MVGVRTYRFVCGRNWARMAEIMHTVIIVITVKIPYPTLFEGLWHRYIINENYDSGRPMAGG